MVAPTHIVDLLRSHSLRDIHRPNMFEVEFETPIEFGQTPRLMSQDLVKSINIPRMAVQEHEIRRMGRKISIPVATQFDILVMNIHDDDIGQSRKFFLDWQRNHYGDIQSGKFNTDLRNVISGNINIYQLNGQHERTTKTSVKRAWPSFIGEMELNHDTEDSLLNFNVTFVFSYIFVSTDAPRFSDIRSGAAAEQQFGFGSIF